MQKQKIEKTRPKFEIQVKKMVNDWWVREGSKSFRKFVRSHFTLYFEESHSRSQKPQIQ